MTPAKSMRLSAVKIIVEGIVQGVGFRPFVYGLAHELQLTGNIKNTSNGVIITLQGKSSALDTFLTTLRTTPPPASRITNIQIDDIAIDKQQTKFSILPSQQGKRPITQISPDIALCSDCRQELFAPQNRRFHYPFINCTHCGPRFSIVEAIPYDRPNTSMKIFPLCPECESEYHDPLNRRFHAQANACPACGPSLSWLDSGGNPLVVEDCITACVDALAAGKVVAIKGLGGFHLAVDATSPGAVQSLRKRKHRKEKPLAIMIRNLELAHEFCLFSRQEAELLSSPRAPIVLVEKKENTPLADQVAPDIGLLGLMLPYTPLHHLLLTHASCPPALVMTSGNLSNEPICTDNNEALVRLHEIADFFLLHDREIVTRVDDSVLRVIAGKARMLRRGRGYAPEPLILSGKTTNTLGCGAEMKSSFCMVRNNEAFISQHIGKLTSPKCLDFYTESIDHLQTVLKIDFQAVACDQHPDYLSTGYCRQQPTPCIQIQHHHAHAAAVMAEHGLDEQVLAILLDGTGYSADGTIYGGEWYLADRREYIRLAHLLELPLPGGDVAAREPWRMAMALLYQAMGEEGLTERNLPPSLHDIDDNKRGVITQMMQKSINCPLTSSCGRLFDAVAGLLGLCMVEDYEGQAAMQLEYQAELALKNQKRPRKDKKNRYAPTLQQQAEKEMIILDTRPLAGWIVEDLRQGTSIPDIALAFHHWLLEGAIETLLRLRHQTGINTVLLSGGAMQNKILLQGLIKRCETWKFEVFSGEQVPGNDGGIALGQAYIAGAPETISLTDIAHQCTVRTKTGRS